MAQISKIVAREIIDSRANPTVEVDLYLTSGHFGRASVPSGASTGIHEALELRDGEQNRFNGKGVLRAVENINSIIAPAVLNKNFLDQSSFDKFLIELDGTANKSKLGANAILALSMAFAKASANSANQPLFRYINSLNNNLVINMPVPMFNLLNGGRHASWSTDFQEFMVIPSKINFRENFRAGCEIFMQLHKSLEQKNASTGVGNEGGFSPGFATYFDAMEFLVESVNRSNYKLGEDVFIGLDIAASEFFDKTGNHYALKKEARIIEKADWIKEVVQLVLKYPFKIIEDPFDQDDWESWQEFTKSFNDKVTIVGDDLLVTNTKRIQIGIEKKACNAVLIKLNQIGTVTETIEAIILANEADWKTVISHRSGETEDTFISHLAVGVGADFIKSGAPNRSERTAKYNELLRIEEELLN